MTKNMLIDAVHPEETRVVITDGNQIEEFDFESSTKVPLRGNIYLAKVTRVEPSLQAAFVEYGGNRHGFLAFNEIHPDYYQIPVSDREALLRAHAEEERENAAEDAFDGDEAEHTSEDNANETVVNIGGDAHEEAQVPVLARALHRKYKIQEVVKRRQIILVQVLKEERGNKGAALTTYLSLAGRYCVLMPNSARGGGISRKIANSADRKKLKKIVEKLEVPDGMGLIARTAGAQRTLVEIRRDWQYLSRLWKDVRETAVSCNAPALVYEEGSLILRCIRDLYSKDFEAVYIDGAEAYKEARNYMKLMMPSHARKVKQHTGTIPIFKTHNVEDKLAAMFNPVVALPSGGYLVINQTEALVAVDVNSGKSTREYSIEKTALTTNLEAASEVGRQARLRDLAGLLVIDFIDMDENRNNRTVENRMKEAMKDDRARIQISRISSFGLMEMSRQRMRTGVLEGSSQACSHCNGSGMVRSVESRALHVLRQIDEECSKFENGVLIAHAPQEVAIYLLNQKRQRLNEIEIRTGVSISITIDAELNAMEMALTLPDQTQSNALRMEGEPTAALDKTESVRKPRRRGGRTRNQSGDHNGSKTDTHEAGTHQVDTGDEASIEATSGEPVNSEATTEEGGTRPETGAIGNEEEKPKRRRRRGRRGGRGRRREAEDGNDENANGDELMSDELAATDAGGTNNDAAYDTEAVPAEAETGREIAVESPADGAAKGTSPPSPLPPSPLPLSSEASQTATDTGNMSGTEDNMSDAGNMPEGDNEPVSVDTDETKPTKRGWWRRA